MYAFAYLRFNFKKKQDFVIDYQLNLKLEPTKT